jgi:hypothetical protein
MLKESTAKIYFRIHVFGSGFQQFGHLHSIGLVDFNWAEAWVIVNEHLLDTPMSLFDSSWFKLEIFKKVPNPLNSSRGCLTTGMCSYCSGLSLFIIVFLLKSLLD